MAVTLKDIARMAGVSVSTVSRVVNNDTDKSASSETAQRIWKIIRETNYVPNETARMLIQRVKDGTEVLEKKSIGCILASYDDLSTDPFFTEVLSGIYEETIRQGFAMDYTFPVANSHAFREAAFFNNVVTRQVSGAVILGRVHSELMEILKKYIPNLVYCGLNYLEEEISQVLSDAIECIRKAVDYLFAQGHRAIGFIGSTNKDGSLLNERRYAAFCDAIRAHGLSADSCPIIEPSQLTLRGGYQAMKAALENCLNATAYFCVNDITAIGVMRAIREHGLRIPEDVSLISVNDTDLCSYVVPSLTTIHVHMKEMGRLAVRALIDRIQTQSPAVRINLPVFLVERESCRAVCVDHRAR